MATELTIDAVKDLIALNDGRVKNTVLVAHFRKFLNDPNKKADARQKFKDYVNTVAVVKTENGEKYVQLKKKYRTAAPISVSHLPPPNVSENNSAQTSPSHNLVSSFDAPILSEKEQRGIQAYDTSPAYDDQRVYQPIDKEENDDGEIPVLSFEPPPSGATHDQVDPTITTPEHKGDGDGPLSSQPQLDPSGVFRVPFPPAERRSLSETPKRSTISTGSVEQARLNFQNNGDDTSSILHSEASADSNKENDFDEDRGGTNFAMDPLEKEWMLMAAKGNMLELRKLLNKDPNLAEKRDFVLGYTALHWASKKGDGDLVRMFGEAGVDVNTMSNGGYTPMHLAAMHGHEKVVQILVEEFEADPHIRNYSGKRAKNYLRPGMISLPIQKLLFGNDGTGSVKAFAAGLRPRLDSVRKSKRLGNAISGGVGVLGALVRGKATSNEDVSSVASASPSIGRKGSFTSKGKKKKSRKWSRDGERPSISLVSANDDMDSGFGSRASSSIHEGMRRGSSSPIVSRPTSSRDSNFRSRGESTTSKRSGHDE